jgi:alpha-L-rhamnosidase
MDPATHLVHNGDGLSALIDTSGGSDDGYHQSPVNSVVNSWSYLAMRSFAKLGRWLGRASDAAALDATADALAAAFQAAMFNGTNAICDGVCALTPHTAAHATFYALYSGILDGAPYKAALVEWLTARTAANGALGMPCGSYPAQFLLGGLYNADGDHGNAAFALLTSTAKHSWLNMMEEFGASVTMECWLPEELDNLSFSHIWSSSPSFTVPFLFFGVTATAPGYAAFTVKPQPGPVVQGAATLPTAAGPIAVAFEQGGEAPGTPASTMTLRVEVPGGTVAKVMLPLWGCAAGKMAVTVDGEVVNFAVEGDYASVEGLKAGVHTAATAPCEK